MMGQEKVLMSEKEFKLKLLVEDTDLDYYTDVVLELSLGERKLVLLKDNLLYLKNLIHYYKENWGQFELDERLEERKLGFRLNESYHGLSEPVEQDSFLLNEQEQWIGEKYCCFLTSQYATWCYRYQDKIILKVTPIFEELDEENTKNAYENFMNGYVDVFRTELTLEQLRHISGVLLDLYARMEA